MSNAPHFDIDPGAFWREPYPALAAMQREHPIAYVPQLGATLFTRRAHIVELEKLTDGCAPRTCCTPMRYSMPCAILTWVCWFVGFRQ
jgi:hypothetical protein